MEFVIEIVDGNLFSAGWVAYVLGLPRDDSADEVWQLGWDTGNETPSLSGVRYVFESQSRLERPQYVVKAPV